MDTSDIGIDDNLRALIDAMNALPGIDTFASCGGHTDAAGADGKAPAGHFYVAFDVDVLRGGWRSLQLITWATMQHESFEAVTIAAWLSGEEPDTMAFQLEGGNGADPENLAGIVRDAAEHFDD